jgi:serine---pyruvate transaminase
MSKSNLLLTPGPTQVPPDILRVMSAPIFHHRTPQYRALFQGVCEDLKEVFRTRRPVLTFTGSGTLAMEAAVVNFCSPGDQVIVVEIGKFGERWRAIAENHGLRVVTLKAEYGDAVSNDSIAQALRRNPDVKAVYGTLCETSTGVLSDVQGIASSVSKTGAIFVVDAISGLAADRLEMDQWGLDVVVCGSQKGFMLPPGLSFIAVSEKAMKLNASARCARFYCDLSRYVKTLREWDTPFTPAITIVLGLREVLNRIKAEGMEATWKRTARLATKTRNAIAKLDLTLFSKHPANTLTAVRVPNGLDGSKLVQVMRDEKGVTVAGGQGTMQGKIVRIAHFGFVTEKDIDKGLTVLKETLQELRKEKTTKVKS